MPQPIRVLIDGVEHTLSPEIDTDRSGRPDTGEIAIAGTRYRCTDLDGDGLPEVVRLCRANGSVQVLVLDVATGTYERLSDTDAPDDSIEEDASHWFAQATRYTCGPAAITMVLADLFDLRLPDERAVWQRAIDMAAIDDRGMSPVEIAEVVNSYGIPASLLRADVGHLETMLGRGHEVILMVDAHDYWPEFDGRGTEDVMREMPHAVRLLAVDTAAGHAVVSDTGRSDPRFSRLRLPIDVLDDAWADLDRLAVITDVSAGEVRQSLLEHGIDVAPLFGARAATPRRRALLPLALRLDRLRARLDRWRRAVDGR